MQDLRLVDEPRQPASVRERELEVGRLVLRAAQERDEFLTRRAASAVASLDPGAVRRSLRRAVQGLVEGDDAAVRTALPAYAAVLEQHGLPGEAGEVYGLLMRLWPGHATTTLHAARAARRAGRREDALALYRQAGRESAGDAHMMLLVRIGAALVSEDAEAELGAVLRDARRSQDADAVAIAREERARLVHARRALLDLAAAAARYRDRTDRVRVLHRMAELMTARGDLLGAREALLAALDQGAAAQQGHSVQRLRTVARQLGDELELRRSRNRGASGPVMLTLGARSGRARRSMAPRLSRWRSLLPAPAGC